MRGLRLGLSLGRGQAGTPAAFSIAFTGLSTDSIGTYGQVGNHAAIGYTITPDNGTETVKWSNSSNPADAATYGTGAAPTDFTASDGSPVYLHVTDGGDTVTRSFTVRKAPATAGAALDLAFPEDSAITPVDLSQNFTENGNTLTYLLVDAPPTGLSATGATLSGTPTTVTADANYTFQGTDEYGRVTSVEHAIEVTNVLQLSAVDLGAQESDGDVPATLTGDNGTYFWILTTTDPAVSPPTRTQVLAGQDHTGSAAAADGTVAATSGVPVNVALPTGLNGSYYLVVADGDSILFDGTAQAIDTTAPTLSGVSTTPGSTTAALDWSTDTGSGTAYWVLTTSATVPSIAQIVAGQDHTGSAATGSGSPAISGSGAQTQISVTSLTNGTTYYFHIFHRDAFANDSTISTASVTPAATFAPGDLFASSEDGAWYDPSDLTTLWQDTARTIQVSADGQTVAAIDDKSGNGYNITITNSARRPTYNTAGGLHWLDLNGTDDGFVTGAMAPGTDKVMMVVGVEKQSSSNAMLLEYSVNWNTNTGSFFLTAPDSASDHYMSGARGSASATAGQLSSFTASGAAPDTAVVSATHDIAGDSSIVRRNGVAASAGTADKGTGNFGNHILSIGSRNGGSIWYDGKIYGIIVRFAAPTGSQLADAEAWMAAKSGVTL